MDKALGRSLLDRGVRAALRDIAFSSVVLNCFSLGAPLASMVIFNKVLPHQATATLTVVAIGMVIVYAFDAALRTARNLIAVHTGARLDAAIGQRVVQHLLRLPIGYFERTPMGETIERLRQLDTVRSFLTGETLNQVLQQFDNLTLAAPVSGTIERLQHNTIGQAVMAGQEIMHIVPEDVSFVIDVVVANQDIGFITEGQRAAIKLKAYDYQRYGILEGSVLSVASDNSAQRTDYTFMVQVKPEAAHLPGHPGLRLRAGMLAEVDFFVGKSTVANYPVDAVTRVQDKAARE